MDAGGTEDVGHGGAGDPGLITADQADAYTAGFEVGFAAGRASQHDEWQDVLSAVVERTRAEYRQHLIDIPFTDVLAELGIADRRKEPRP